MSGRRYRPIETTALPVSIEEGSVVYEDPTQRIRKVVARFADFSKEYYVSDHGRNAAIVAIRQDHVLLVRQYRLLKNGISIEIPGGRIEESESPREAAVRECEEETGIRCGNAALLIEYHSSLEILKNHTHVFYSEESLPISSDRSDRLLWVPMTECLRMVFDGRISDSLSVLALLAYQVKRRGQFE